MGASDLPQGFGRSCAWSAAMLCKMVRSPANFEGFAVAASEEQQIHGKGRWAAEVAGQAEPAKE